MKIYEKPMAIIEKIEVEDVITTSVVAITADEEAALKTITESTDVILFQW